MSSPLDSVTTVKAKLGALVAASVAVATFLALVGRAAGVPVLLLLPVTIALALGVTQLLASGMTAPLRQMTEVAGRMARGDYSGRVTTSAVDEIGQLARAFNQMASDLAEVDRERRDLIATVSHELRTPLTAMTALLENLADGVVPADREHLAEALKQAERLRDLVRDLLELSRLEAGVARLQIAPVRLAPLVADAVDQVRAAGREGSCHVTIPADMVVSVDEARLRQVLVNALDNALRHSPEGEDVTVSAASSEGAWWLEVVDRGPGVPVEQRERVFERFGADPAGGGTGMGLAVARWVAQLHGGSLRFVDPASGHGARLRLEVPVEPNPVCAVGPAAGTPDASTASAGGAVIASGAAGVRTSYLPPTPQRPVSGLDGLFGRWWPERGMGPGHVTVIAAVVAGLVTGVGLSFTDVGVSWTVAALVCGAAALATARRRRDPWTLFCSALAVLLVLPLTLLAAPWVRLLCMVAAPAVFLCGVTAARTMPGILLTGVAWPLASLRGLPWFGRSVRLAGTGTRTPAVVRTAAWSLLGLGVFGTIFASASPVFGSWVDELVPNLSFNAVVGRAFLACFVFAATLAAGYLALNPARVDLLAERRPAPLANRFEWLVPVLVVDGVFLAFVAAQARALIGGEDYIQRSTGLTYAEFVHKGFGQLTLATALTVLVVWVASRRAGDSRTDRQWLFGSLGLLCTLTLLVVASALRGMSVYQDAYGFTTLRLFVDVLEGWLGFVVLSIMVAGVLGRGRWLPRIALVSGAVALLGLAAINPDAWVASQNIDRYDATGKLDVHYLQDLSVDAVPVVVDRLPEELSRCVLRYVPLNGLRPEVLEDARAWNLGRWRADRAIDSIDITPRGAERPDACAGVLESVPAG